MRITFNSSNAEKRGGRSSFWGLLIGLVLLLASGGYCDDVDPATARLVAENTLRRHVALHGDWNGTTAPTVADGAAVHYQGRKVAYNFSVTPGGHVLVAADDALSPVLLYSPRSSFEPERVARAGAIESWIVPELHHQVGAIQAYRSSADNMTRSASISVGGRRIADAWTACTSGSLPDSQGDTDTQVRSVIATNENEDERDLVRTATVGPLLTTAWGQASPYNLMTPNDSCGSGHTLTGCVATAWAQLLRYWSWPIRGTDSHNYDWESQTLDPLIQNLSADFEFDYQWHLMPDVLSEGSSADEKDAVALLMYHMGVAAEMQYGCDGSGSSAWADDVLGVYFKFKQEMLLYVNRANPVHTGEQWFALIKAELDADPPRPVVFSIFGTAGGGHEVIIDGYQTSPTDMVHINYGWTGYSDGYYNITVDFSAGGVVWDANDQHVVTGIAPDNTPPTVEAGDSRTVDEASEVQLSGSAEDPEGVGISSYSWTQLSGPTVALSDNASTSPTFTAPEVHAETELVFRFRADDVNRGYAAATCTITVSNTDGSTAPAPPAPSRDSGGGGGGGCFISSLVHF